MNECEHNNTITNHCSDCDEQEYLDNGGNEGLYNIVLQYTLQEVIEMLFGGSHCVLNDIIFDSITKIDLLKKDQEELNKWCAEKVALEVNRRLIVKEEV